MMPESEGLLFVRDGAPVTLDWKGYDHFAYIVCALYCRVALRLPGLQMFSLGFI